MIHESVDAVAGATLHDARDSQSSVISNSTNLISLGTPANQIDLDQRIIGKSCDADAGPCGQAVGRKP